MEGTDWVEVGAGIIEGEKYIKT